MSEPEKKKRKTKRRSLRINTEAQKVRRNTSTTAKIPQEGFKQSCYLCVKKKRSTLIDIATNKEGMIGAIERNGIYQVYLKSLIFFNKKIGEDDPNAEIYYDYKWRLKNGVNETGRYISLNGKSVPICGICYNRNVRENPEFKALHPRVGGTKKRRKRKKRKYRRKSSKKRKRKTRKKY